MPPRASPSVLFIAPDLHGPPGGIARYCRMVVDALQGVDPAPRLSVVALHDATQAGSALSYRYYGSAGSRRRFAQRVLAEGLRSRPALVLVGHLHLAPVVAWWCRLTGTPVIQFLYGIEAWEPLAGLRRWSVRQARRYVAISRYTARRAAEVNGIDPSKTSVLYNCLDPAFASTSPTGRDGAPSLLTVTRLSRADSYKGVDVVLRALPRIRAEVPEVVYDIAGDGDARGDLEALAASLGVADCTRFHGRVTDEALRELYARSSVFVMPSRNEGFGFVFLEAMAQGTPAVGGNRDATPEVIIDGETGYTVDPESPRAIAEAVLRLLKDEPLRERMGQNARHHARETFAFETFRDELERIVAGLLN